MKQSQDMTFEEMIERRLHAIERQQSYIFEALRALGQALGVRDKIDQLIASLSAPPDPAE